MSFNELKNRSALHLYKGEICKILAHYGDTCWIEVNNKRMLVSTDKINVEISSHN